MKILNTRTSKYLIESIEIDLYDILYKAQFPQKQNFTVPTEVTRLLVKYREQGFIKDFVINITTAQQIVVSIFTPKKTTIRCQIP